jgi:hypothetical protein
MSLFVCQKCRVIENTACSGFWLRKMKNEQALCSQCDPDFGEWHGLFERRIYDGTQNVQWADGAWLS